MVNRHHRSRKKSHHRSHIHHAPLAPFDHIRQEQLRHNSQSLDIDVNHIRLLLQLRLQECPVQTEARIIDKIVDGDPLLLELRGNLLRHAGDATSLAMTVAWMPYFFRYSFDSSNSLPSLRATSTKSYPPLAKRSANSLPIPPDTPVISTVFLILQSTSIFNVKL